MEVKINTPSLTLGQFLKYVGCIDTGGQVKALLAQKAVKVNGQLVGQRGRKLYGGDVVEVNNKQFTIIE